MQEDIGTYDFKALRRGDTFIARNIAQVEEPAGTPKAIASARMDVRTKFGLLVYSWHTLGDTPNASITGAGSNVVTLDAVEPASTSLFPPGDHEYDLEVVWAAGGTRTILKGTFPVAADITRTIPV
jgi:hypothetical protein